MSGTTETRATGVVVYDNFDNPVMVAYELADRILTMSMEGSPDFKEKLQQAGVQKAATVTELVTDGQRIRFLT